MQRSLFSGVSGLTNHQSILDITANNLANISTSGYKGARTTFATALSQTSFAGAAPGVTGGINPRQVGLGTQTASTDVDMRQGALVSTGRSFDLAIQGAGFFMVRNGDRTFYTRVGNFGFDADSTLVDLSSGNKVVGNIYGENNSTTPVAFNTPISIPSGTAVASRITSTVTMQGNLSSTAKAIQGTRVQSLFPLTNSRTGEAATSDTDLKDLTIFKDAVDPGTPEGRMRAVHLYGTKPDGTGWSGMVSVNVWQDQVGDLIDRMNSVLVESNVRFGTVGLEDGNIAASAVGVGDGFSLFMGDVIDDGAIAGNAYTRASAVVSATGGLTDTTGVTYATGTQPAASLTNAIGSSYNGVGSATLDTGSATGLFGASITRARPSLAITMPAVDYSAAVGGPLVIRLTNTTTGAAASVSIPAADYTGGGTFTINDPALDGAIGDSYSLQAISGFDLGGGNNLTWATSFLSTQSSQALALGSGTASGVVPPSANRVRPVTTFTIPAQDYSALSGPLKVQVRNTTTGATATVDIPAADYTGVGVNRNFSINSLSLIGSPSDTYATSIVSGFATGTQLTWSTEFVDMAFQTDPEIYAAAALTDATGVAFNGAPTTLISGSAAAAVGGTNTQVRLAPTFIMPAIDYSGSAFVGQTLTVTATNATTGQTLGTVTIPAADYSQASSNRTFTLSALPKVNATDTITFTMSGSLNLNPAGGTANRMTISTNVIDTTNIDNMVVDADADGQPNMLDLDAVGAEFDPSAWQYADHTNNMFNWYRSRFVPDVRTTSIEVFDALGGKHVMEARMFRNGTKIDPTNPAAKRNSWDLVVGVKASEGAVVDDLIAGIEFDQSGRFTGDFGRTVKGSSLSDLGYAGDPASRTVRVDWGTTGTTSPSTIDIDLGTSASIDGLTGFGSASTANAIQQDGYPDGKLDTLSVSSSGDIIGLFTNGISRRMAQLQVATFQNPAALTSVGGNLWSESPNSGTATARDAGQSGAGTITAGSLEGSNVDIATEFTRLITAQRGFQVNARVIQTTDSVLQELASLIR